MYYILRFLLAMLRNAAPALLILVPWRVCLGIRTRRRGGKVSPAHETVLALFFLFSVGLASLTVFPLDFQPVDPAQISLIPMRFVPEMIADIKAGSWKSFLIDFLGNIVMFMPLGFFPALLNKKCAHLRAAALIGCCSSLFIEVTQLFLPRATDVDDLILNTLGAVLGYLAFAAVQTAAPKFVERCRG